MIKALIIIIRSKANNDFTFEIHLKIISKENFNNNIRGIHLNYNFRPKREEKSLISNAIQLYNRRVIRFYISVLIIPFIISFIIFHIKKTKRKICLTFQSSPVSPITIRRMRKTIYYRKRL